VEPERERKRTKERNATKSEGEEGKRGGRGRERPVTEKRTQKSDRVTIRSDDVKRRAERRKMWNKRNKNL